MEYEPQEDRSAFITTYKPVAGWKAVMYWWNDEENDGFGGFWEPWQTSYFAYPTEEEAIAYAKDWAQMEDVRYLPRVKSFTPL